MSTQELIIDRPENNVFRVSRAAMTSHEILDLEQSQIFERCWLYVGHESEIEKRGDFKRRVAAGRPLIFVRGSDDAVRVLYNTCPHRGAQVCGADNGNAERFQCFYHGWTFNNKGDLVTLPDSAGYGGKFNKAEHGLTSPPRVEQYRGFYFVNFNREAEDLATYLGQAREIMDLTIDSAESLGGWTILKGTAKYSINSNWKLLAENSCDGYHLQMVHQSYLDYMDWRRSLNGFNDRVNPGAVSGGFALRNGHGGMLQVASGRAIANPSPVWNDDVNREVERIRRENIARFGEARGRQMCEVSRHLLLFPNIAFQDSQTGFRIRQFWPAGVDRVDVMQWDFVPRNERKDLRASRMEMSLAFLGPGGLATPDDVEVLEACQRGFGASEVEWSDISRGMNRSAVMFDELQMRSFWRGWHSALQGKLGQGRVNDNELHPSPITLELGDF
ncbi:MAG: aromatic ring-hydroxylating oxygenase subunit alpha [Alphaproteobacteria bacterium]